MFLENNKNILKNNGEALTDIIFDEDKKLFFPRQDVFKQSQSNIFLQYYNQRYCDKKKEQDSGFSAEAIENEINNYRSEKYGKARIFYYNLKYFTHIKEKFDRKYPQENFKIRSRSNSENS